MHLLARQGLVRKVVLPGRQRASGFRFSDIQALIAAASLSPSPKTVGKEVCVQ